MEPQTQPAPPVMDVVPPPANEPPADTPPAPKADKPQTVSKAPVLPEQKSRGVGLAIFATVVIVIVLAALATLAYLKQNHQL